MCYDDEGREVLAWAFEPRAGARPRQGSDRPGEDPQVEGWLHAACGAGAGASPHSLGLQGPGLENTEAFVVLRGSGKHWTALRSLG